MLIAPLATDNLVLFGWLPDSYLLTSVWFMFLMALALVLWLIIGRVLWDRRVTASRNVVE